MRPLNEAELKALAVLEAKHGHRWPAKRPQLSVVRHGEAAAAPPQRARRKRTYRDGPGRSTALEIAVRVARAYRDRAPTVEGLQDQFGMCRATAYRWLRAWKDAGVLEAK